MKPWKILVASLALCPALATAHAFLDHASPKVGEEVSSAPACVCVWFTQDIEPAFSHLTVSAVNGAEVDLKDSHADTTNAKALIVSLTPNLPAGEYKVMWNVVSTDTHHTHGDFTFVIKAK